MQVQPIDNKRNVSMKALYFPAKPETGAVVCTEIKEAIKHNPFIKHLSEKTNVLARFHTTNDGTKMYHLRLDVFDKETDSEVASMLYSSRMYGFNGGKTNLSETEFISHIKRPETITKTVYRGNWFDRLLGRKKEQVETIKKQTDFYNFSFLGTKDTYPLKEITPKITEDLRNAEKQIREINNSFISETIS